MSEGAINILCSLSTMVFGNRDLIEYIYRKKKLIEYNENLLYYLLTGLQNGRLYSYTIVSFENTTQIIYESLPNEKEKERLIFYSSGEDRIKKYSVDKGPLSDFFMNSFMVHKIHYYWENLPSKDLKKDQQWCQKVMLDALFIPNFMFIRCIPGFTETIFKIPSLKQKITALNHIVMIRGVLYLDLIKEEFKEEDISYCVILDENGDVETIYGGEL